jgi:hypothetical protein
MKVEYVSGMQNNGRLCESVLAYQNWGVDPTNPLSANPAGQFGIATYTPFSGFADEYFAHFQVNLAGANAPVEFDAPITKIWVLNNIERNFGEWRDVVMFETGAGLLTISNTFFPMSGNDIPQVAPPSDIYLENALLALPRFLAGNSGDASGPTIRIGDTNHFSDFTRIGSLTAIPEPGALSLAALALLCLARVKRPAMRAASGQA